MKRIKSTGLPNSEKENEPLFWGYSFKQISIFFAGIFVLHLVLTYIATTKFVYSISLGDLQILLESTFIPVILLICVKEIKKSSPTNYKAWLLILIATLFNLFGDLYKFLYDILSIASPADTSVDDILYMFFYPFFIWGLLSFKKEKISKPDKIKLALDLSVILLTCILILAAFIIGSLYVISNNNPEIYLVQYGYILAFIYPVLDLACLFSVFYIFLRSRIKIPKGVAGLIELGIVFYTMSDLIYFYESPAGLYNIGGIVEHGYILAEILLILAGIYQILVIRYPKIETEPSLIVKFYNATYKLLKQSSSIWIVLIAVSLWWLHHHPEYHPFYDFTVGGLILALILSTIRLFVTAKENNLITSNLKRIVGSRTKHLNKTLNNLRIEMETRKEIGSKLKESEEKYRKLFENDPNAVFMFDFETLNIVDCNQAFSTLYGYNNEEIKKLNVCDLSSEPDKTISNIRNSELLSVVKFPIRYHKKKNGTIFPVEITHTSMFIMGKLTVSAIIKDISEKIETEKKQREYTEELEKLNKAKDKFFSIIAHDLRNPFQGLLGYLELLDSKDEIISEDEKAYYISQLNIIAGTLYGLVDNLLQWSRIQSGTMKINKSKIDLFEIADRTIKPLTMNSQKKNIKILNEIMPGFNVVADEMSIKLILSNLITNAIKFTNNDGEIKLITTSKSEGAYLYVIDNGVGIAPEKLHLLFDLERQTTSQGTNMEHGTGLGLTICKELIELNGGRIKVESIPQKGTTVEVFIPNHVSI